MKGKEYAGSTPQQQMPTSPPPGAAKKKKTGLVLALTSILAVALGLTLAWLTASDTKHNVFEFGEVNIELIEPGWDSNFDEGIPDDEKVLTNVVPGQVVTKDPRMKNTGSAAAWVYTSVYVPKINGIPVFSWDEKLGEGWVVDTVSRSEKYDIYTFIYDKPLEGNSETPPVFEKVIIKR